MALNGFSVNGFICLGSTTYVNSERRRKTRQAKLPAFEVYPCLNASPESSFAVSVFWPSTEPITPLQ